MQRASIRNNTESTAHVQIERETKLARTIPPRKASENHISGSWVSCSCNLDVGGEFVMVPIQHPLLVQSHSDLARLHYNKSILNFCPLFTDQFNHSLL